MYRFTCDKISKISNYKYIINITIVIIVTTATIVTYTQYKSLRLQQAESEISKSSLKNIKNIHLFINSLQKERALSTISFTKNNQKNHEALINQRKETKKLIDDTKITTHYKVSLNLQRAKIIENIDSLKYNQYDIFNNYTNLIQNLLHIQYEQILHLNHSYIRHKLFFNTELSMLQEIISQLRTKIIAILESEDITQESLSEIIYLKISLDSHLNDLHLSDEYKTKYTHINEILNNEIIKQTLEIINQIATKSTLNELNLSTSQWFIISTGAIDKLIEFTNIDLKKIYIDNLKIDEHTDLNFMVHIFLWLIGFTSLIILFITSYKKANELKQQHDLLMNYKKAVDYRTIISKTDKRGIITYVNDAFCKISGYSEEELLNKNHNIVRHTDMSPEAFKEMWQLLKQGKTWEGRIKNRKKDGSFYWVDATVSAIFDNKNEIIGYIAMRHDITDIVLLNEELIKVQNKLKEQTIRDPLTNLYNRRYLQDIAQDLINIAKRDKTPLSIIILDIDKFKNINDSYGHAIGDDVIVLLSLILKKQTRLSDVVARIGGEEFIILLPNTNIDGALTIANLLRETVENESVEVDGGKNINFTISLGVDSIDSNSDKNIDGPMQRADRALYSAKDSGRNTVVCFKH